MTAPPGPSRAAVAADAITLVLTVGDDRTVEVRRRDNDAVSPRGRVRLDGLDFDLVRLFERWLSERGREWRRNELVVFGSLLHRALLQDVWPFVLEQLERLQDGQLARLQLVFPSERDTHLATIPWEYLYVPAGTGRNGWFLATDKRLVLSRYLPSSAGRRSLEVQATHVRVLAVVSAPDDPRLGDVVAEPVLERLRRLPEDLPVTVDVLTEPTYDALLRALADVEPHVLHFVGHGQYLPDTEEGQLALVDDAGGALWVSDRELAELLHQGPSLPHLVVLHSCEGARADYSADFAGLAPQLVRAGVPCVVAMQYPVTNRAAIEFSARFYSELTVGKEVDQAVQAGRWRIAGPGSGLREVELLGVPVVYLSGSDARLFSRRAVPARPDGSRS